MKDPKVCLKNVVGLLPVGCVCSEEGRPEDYATSTSGLYLLDRGFGLTFDRVNQLKWPDGTTIWDFLTAAREAAISYFFTDLARNIPTTMRAPYTKHDGFIGALEEFTSGLTSGLGERVGWAAVPQVYKGMAVKIRGFRLFCPGLTDGTIQVHRSTDILKGDVTPYKSVSFTGVAPDVLQIDVPAGEDWRIDLEDEYNQPVVLFFSYLRGASNPLNTKFFCGSCGLPAWFRLFHPKVISIADTLSALQSIQQLRTCSYQNYNNGLAVDLSLNCSDGWICSEWNFSADWPRVMADAIHLYGQRETRLALLGSWQIVPATIFKRDELLKEVDNLNKLIADRMLWLGANVPVNMSDCYICDERMVVTDHIVTTGNVYGGQYD